jgi:aspartate-semialdehyde dehydrogenase
MPVDASGKDEVLVGRIRNDVSDPTGCSLRCSWRRPVAQGRALNAVQIAERLLG